MGKGANKKTVLSVLIVMIALATVNVVQAILISDTDTQSGSYTKGTAFVQGNYNGLVYSGSGYMRGDILKDLPANNFLAIYYIFDYIDDSGYHYTDNYPGVYTGAYLKGQWSRVTYTGYPTANHIGSGGQSGYGVPGNPKNWETSVYALIPYS